MLRRAVSSAYVYRHVTRAAPQARPYDVTSAPAIDPHGPRRFRIRESRLPLQHVIQKVIESRLKNPVPKEFTMTQYLGWANGTWRPNQHINVERKFRNKAHVLNPYLKISEDRVKAIEACALLIQEQRALDAAKKGEEGNKFADRDAPIDGRFGEDPKGREPVNTAAGRQGSQKGKVRSKTAARKLIRAEKVRMKDRMRVSDQMMASFEKIRREHDVEPPK